MAFYGFEYFCGANVVVSVEGLPILEAAGISYEARDSKMPIYGYSSRHYDAVAAGQVIIQGTLLINFVHQDYLFRAIQRGLGQRDGPNRTTTIPAPAIPGDAADLKALSKDFETASAFIQNMRDMYWTNKLAGELPFSEVVPSYSPHDIMGGLDLTIAFGEQSATRPAGTTAVRLRDVHFTGRGNVVKIDEDVIVESYPFFARDVYSLRNRPAPITEITSNGDTRTSQG
jgi:hypothetical protein